MHLENIGVAANGDGIRLSERRAEGGGWVTQLEVLNAELERTRSLLRNVSKRYNELEKILQAIVTLSFEELQAFAINRRWKQAGTYTSMSMLQRYIAVEAVAEEAAGAALAQRCPAPPLSWGESAERQNMLDGLAAYEEQVQKLEARLESVAGSEDRRYEQMIGAIAKNGWCLVPPNQETMNWSIYQRFDGEFGYQDELASEPTLVETLRAAIESEEPQSREENRK